MIRHVFIAVTLMCVMAGCAQTAPTPQSRAEELLASYRPRNVRLFELVVNDTVPGLFDEDFAAQKFSWPSWFRFDPSSRALEVDDPRILWLVQSSDLVVFGRHALSSNRHDIEEPALAVWPERQSAVMSLGGIPFRFTSATEERGRVFWGPYTVGSFSMDLALVEGEPVTRTGSILRLGAFPMLKRGEGRIDYVHANVTTDVTIRYWGNASLQIPPQLQEDLQNNPATLELAFETFAGDEVPGARFGQRMPSCGAVVLKSYDPCMNTWMVPIF